VRRTPTIPARYLHLRLDEKIFSLHLLRSGQRLPHTVLGWREALRGTTKRFELNSSEL
jgi:hypothetical protein